MDENPLQDFITAFVRPTDEEWHDLTLLLQLVHFKKGQRLVEIGGTCPYLYFVSEGLARHYFFDTEGNEITTWFSEVGSLATDYGAFTMQLPTQFEVQALTDMRCQRIAFQQLQLLYDRSKTWERMGRLINQQYLHGLIERNNAMYTKTARQRYEAFCTQQGHLFKHVALKHIASYLGITLETLSRLRSDVY